MYRNKKIHIVIPFYNDSKYILSVIEKIPDFVDKILIIDDQSHEAVPFFKSEKLSIIKNKVNLGVGGATIAGFKKILEFYPDIIVKVDADEQMDMKYLPELLNPIIDNRAEFSKGNRFQDFRALKRMPLVRRIGNLGLSFLTKAATGYWDVFDPTNGYFAIKADYLKKIDLKTLHNRYFFETSLLAELYFQNVRIFDVPMKAIYNNEKSKMKIWKELFYYPFRLIKIFFKRILFKYFLYNFNIVSVYILMGIPLFLFGTIYGTLVWITNSKNNILTPTGTIMIITLSIILGFQLILQAILIDIEKSPKPS